MAESDINATAAAVLGLLHEGAMTGGQLMAAAEKRLGSYWSMTRSQVYRELPVLASLGYVKAGKPGQRSSQPYSITAAGKKAFSRWLEEDPGRELVRNPYALRVAFGQALGTGATKLRKEAETYHTEQLSEAREAAKEAKRDGDKKMASGLEFAVNYHKAALTWLKTGAK
jgi:DNA-binding PadR family transcriptional regulator